MGVDVLLGLQWGDEGKGKIVDVLTKSYNIIARFQGGPNAGHTLEFNEIKHVLHTIPSGVFHKNKVNIIGNGVVIDPVIFKKEIEGLEKYSIDIKKTLLISKKAHLILPTHRILDAASEISKGKLKIGSTLKGIGPAYMDKTGRNGVRVGDIISSDWKIKYNTLLKKHLNLLKNFKKVPDYDLKLIEKEFVKGIEILKKFNLIDSEQYLFEENLRGKNILAEGAQGSMLDVDFGTYPFVTSSTTTASGACTGLGISPTKIKDVFGIFKAYATRVGSGPFPSELFDENGEKMSKIGKEFGATTGRARRCGWIDLVALKYSIQINGVTKLMIMKSDVLSGFKKIKICIGYKINNEIFYHLPYDINSNKIEPLYEEIEGWSENISDVVSEKKLPKNFINYIKYLEDKLSVPIVIISVGPDRKQTIFRENF